MRALLHTNQERKEHCYLPDPLQGLGERALGSALELLKSLPTATLLLRLHWDWSRLLTHLHTHGEREGDRDRKQWVRKRERGRSSQVYLCLCKWKGWNIFFQLSFLGEILLCWHFGGNAGHNWNRDRKWVIKRRQLGICVHQRCADVTCLLSPGSVCWWLLCLSSYRFLKETITNSFSSWSLLGRALWNTDTKHYFYKWHFLFNPGK